METKVNLSIFFYILFFININLYLSNLRVEDLSQQVDHMRAKCQEMEEVCTILI